MKTKSLKRWTTKRISRLKKLWGTCHKNGNWLTYREISERMNRSYDSVRNKIRRHILGSPY